MKLKLKFTIERKKKVDEFDDIRNQLYEQLGIWKYKNTRESIGIVMDHTVGVSNFGSYSVYINGLDWVWLDDLKNTKGFKVVSIERTNTGLKFGVLSDRTESETTRSDEK